ncbi:hypothetical protein BKA80DRAFT_136155 [Phyllosticta citrichinensis]
MNRSAACMWRKGDSASSVALPSPCFSPVCCRGRVKSEIKRYRVFLASSETGTRVQRRARGLSMWRSHGTHPRLRSCFGLSFAAAAAACSGGTRGDGEMREAWSQIFESNSRCFPIILSRPLPCLLDRRRHRLVLVVGPRSGSWPQSGIWVCV